MKSEVNPKSAQHEDLNILQEENRRLRELVSRCLELPDPRSQPQVWVAFRMLCEKEEKKWQSI